MRTKDPEERLLFLDDVDLEVVPGHSCLQDCSFVLVAVPRLSPLQLGSTVADGRACRAKIKDVVSVRMSFLVGKLMFLL